ncbi:MAG: tetratricopeptide repeat protein [Candidatus Delongbacteria bacterium]|nr:tetratricopeptide repeat protein [Candidatus Delongbacteria bacterium]MBN2837001.1 tetratricopeptide repeat protein [Candidatus Delongbacteria bacterium]
MDQISDFKKKFKTEKFYFIRLAEHYFENGEIKKCEKLMTDYGYEYENFVSVDILRAKILQKSKKFEESLTILERLAVLEPKNQLVFELMGEAYLGLGISEKYRDCLKKIYETDPFNKSVKTLLGYDNRKSIVDYEETSIGKSDEKVDPEFEENELVIKSGSSYASDMRSHKEVLTNKRIEALKNFKNKIHRNENLNEDDIENNLKPHVDIVSHFEEFEEKEETLKGLDDNLQNEEIKVENDVILPDLSMDNDPAYNFKEIEKETSSEMSPEKSERPSDDVDVFDLLEEEVTPNEKLVEASDEYNEEELKKIIQKSAILNEEELSEFSQSVKFYNDIDLVEEERVFSTENDEEATNRLGFIVDEESNFKKVVVDSLVKPDKKVQTKKQIKIATTTLGQIYDAQGKYQEARDNYKEMLQKDPNNIDYKIKLVDAEFNIGRTRVEEEMNYYTALLDKFPENKKYLDRFKKFKEELDYLKKERDDKVNKLKQRLT